MENNLSVSSNIVNFAKSDTMIEKIMYYAPSSYLGSHAQSEPLIDKFNVE